ncbi:MAG: ADP-ribosylation factor-like protein [archaeon]|nr:ADP-ribosylation factor-like protein [archaeon]
MGGSESNLKYVLLYGEEGAGKTLFEYKLQQNNEFDYSIIQSTYGISFEKLSVKDLHLGMFDLSGSKKQYDIVNILTKYVNIEGIIFIISLENLEKIEEAKDCLERILGNNFINPGLALFVIYNKKGTGDRLDWMGSEMNNDILDNRLGLEKLKKKYKLKNYVSFTIDISEMKKTDLEKPLAEFSKALV